MKYYKKWEQVIGRKINIIVDKDSKKWGNIVEGKEVFSPEKIKELPQNEIFILIFSQVYYVEIAQQLKEMALVEGEQFDIVSREVVLWEPKM